MNHLSRLKGIYLVILFSALAVNVWAQNSAPIQKSPFSKEIYQELQHMVLGKSLDSLANLNQHGLIYIKFKLANGGMQDLSISATAPATILERLNLALISVNNKWFSQFSNAAGERWYVLPVAYDFSNRVKSTTITQSLERIEKMKKTGQKTTPSILRLFDIQDMEKDFGLECVLLPVLKLQYTVVDVFEH